MAASLPLVSAPSSSLWSLYARTDSKDEVTYPCPPGRILYPGSYGGSVQCPGLDTQSTCLGASLVTLPTVAGSRLLTPAVEPSSVDISGTLTITGTGLDLVTAVEIGGGSCEISDQSETQISCVVGEAAGQQNFTVWFALRLACSDLGLSQGRYGNCGGHLPNLLRFRPAGPSGDICKPVITTRQVTRRWKPGSGPGRA